MFRSALLLALWCISLAVLAGDCAPCACPLQAQLKNQRTISILEALASSQRRHASAHGRIPLPVSFRLRSDPLSLVDGVHVQPNTAFVETPQSLPSAIARLARIRTELRRRISVVNEESFAALEQMLPKLLGRTSNGSDLQSLQKGGVLTDTARALPAPRWRRVEAMLMSLADPELVRNVAGEFSNRDPVEVPDWAARVATGTLLAARRDAAGPILVGGPGPNRYLGSAALIIDLGGDDEYLMAAANGVQAIIDLAGDDVYIGLADGAIAGAILGAALVADHNGNDRYIGKRISLGAAVGGVGILIDSAGDDRYTGLELTQGAALAGRGLLRDDVGDDVFVAAKFGQGFGGALGTGALRDATGEDRYFAGGRHPSSYGTPGRFQAFSQGVGMGFRNDIAGGIGLLHDGSGDDEYHAANFAQGTGYYFGVGVLRDDSGDDRYTGARYAQGSAAHFGTGLLQDRSGHDRYRGTVAATQGGAWDLAVAAFVDCRGDDRYRTNQFSLGAAAQHAFGLFADMGGSDQYRAGGESAGYSGPDDDRADAINPGNLGVFFDRGSIGTPPNGERRVSTSDRAHEDVQ